MSRRRASHRVLTFSVDRDVWGMSKFYLVGVYSFFSRKIDSSSDENEQKRKDKASSFPPRRDVCVSSSDDVCSREIKRVLRQISPKEEGGEVLVVLSVAKEKD